MQPSDGKTIGPACMHKEMESEQKIRNSKVVIKMAIASLPLHVKLMWILQY
jgi:hypothetical protein